MRHTYLTRSLPKWVEADPLRARAVDALGFQGAADRVADRLLPGISVLTTRARYYSFLAWARRACGRQVDEEHIHRLEVALALREAKLHGAASDGLSEPRVRCSFVGSRSLRVTPRDEAPEDPREVYKVPVWRAYRASMRSLGLLDGEDLTDVGASLATAFAAACRPSDRSGGSPLPAAACLSRLGRREAGILQERFGVGRRGSIAAGDQSGAARRAAVQRELGWPVDGGYDVAGLLQSYESRRRGAGSQVECALQLAAVWERLTVGLNAAFLLLLHNLDRPGAVIRSIDAARRGRYRGVPPLESIAIDADAAKHAIRSVRRALELRRTLGEDALAELDNGVFQVGEELVSRGKSVGEVLGALMDRHHAAKGDDAWVREGDRGHELARDPGDTWKLPNEASLHRYRLDAWGSVLHDLRLAHWGDR